MSDLSLLPINQLLMISLTPIPTQPLENNNKNECFNLTTQTLQQTIQALSLLVQQISTINLSDPTSPPIPTKKNKATKKKELIALFESYLDEDDD
ncbi:hypothetical protein TNCV_709231 [Trichonephila clavipes]|nr:hypothetical protein TNCV_709231 [Trichonephila clavipes]